MIRTIFLLVLGCSLLSCKRTAPPAEGLPRGFADFYEKFHEDSIYQMEHITFPLAGLPDNYFAKNADPESFTWQPKDWVMHKPYKRGETVFDRSFNVINDDMVEELFRSKDRAFAMIRRFARSGKEWRLIYYAGMNPVSQDGGQDSL